MEFDWVRRDLPKDSVSPFMDATIKPMKSTGEVVLRQRSKVPGMHTKRTRITMAKMWEDPTSPPWQNPHYHKGLTEGYIVTKGWMIAVWQNPTGSYDDLILTDVNDPNFDSIIVFQPERAHNVLLGPGAEIVVWQSGQPILDKALLDPQDRYPATSFDFDYGILEEEIKQMM